MRGTLVSFIGAACRTACVLGVISASRPRQPREEEMKCGTQPADIRMIHRRSHLSHVAFLLRRHADLYRRFRHRARENPLPSPDRADISERAYK
jgi:hypothetical protein